MGLDVIPEAWYLYIQLMTDQRFSGSNGYCTRQRLPIESETLRCNNKLTTNRPFPCGGYRPL